MDSNILGGLIKRIYSDFNLNSFENRLKLQKIIFLMRSHDLDLGYNYNLYMRGPYSVALTRDAFLIDDWTIIEETSFTDPGTEQRFTTFINKIKPYKNNTKWLEIASTLLLIRSLKNPTDEQLIKECNEIKNDYTIKEIELVLNEMKQEGFIWPQKK